MADGKHRVCRVFDHWHVGSDHLAVDCVLEPWSPKLEPHRGRAGMGCGTRLADNKISLDGIPGGLSAHGLCYRDHRPSGFSWPDYSACTSVVAGSRPSIAAASVIP